MVYLSGVVMSVPHRRSKLMLSCIGSSSVVLPVGSRLWGFDCLLHEMDSQLFKSMHNILYSVYCLTPETLHTLIREETTHMNSCIIITASLGVPLSIGPSTILCYVWFYFILLQIDI